MARRKPAPVPVGLTAPTHSLDATDWRMYCDLLQDADAPKEEWQRANRIAESLALDPKLVLINRADPAVLENHHLRVGQRWFIGADRTQIDQYDSVWWRQAWVREGFNRYPCADSRRIEYELILLNYGTPGALPHPRFGHWSPEKRQKALVAFFDSHACATMPEEYL